MLAKGILKKIIFIGVLVFAFFISWQSARLIRPVNIKLVEIAGQRVVVDVVDTPESRAQGLSGRESLAEDEGMLFVFEKPGKYNFWMQGMNFAIDIIWINENKEVIYIQRDARPEDYPTTFGPDENAKYVLEVLSGFSDKNNLQIGDVARFTF
jgi:uncharacterized membrane protein (UPF0127 family)